jgi:uncharacterized protein YlxP (DUF503 family)
MLIYVVKVKIRMEWVHSLKEKRMVVKSICAKLKNHFNVSVAEVEEQDIHQLAVIAYAYIAGNQAQGDSIYENTIDYLEENTDGEIINVDRQIY